MTSDKPKYWSTFDAAVLAGVTPQTLAAYERDGVLPPPMRDSRGSRLWTAEDIARARQINEARAARHGKTGQRRSLFITSTVTK